jgi:predicted phosphohydrolase
MTIYAISDLHTDNKDNRDLLNVLSANDYGEDTLLIAGDISNRLQIIKDTFLTLSAQFKHLFFMPGNHEFWVSKESDNSLTKLDQILALCDDLGIHTRPKMIEEAWIVPLFSWYESMFYPAGDPDSPELEGWGDYHLCKWPDPVGNIPFDPLSHFIDLNKSRIRDYDRPVISFSHFVPRLELIPPQRILFFKSLPMVAGSTKIEEMVRKINSKLHVFGHTHINVDHTIDGVRYLQNGLRYPRERKMFSRPNALKLEQVWPLVHKEDDVPWKQFL